MLPLARPHELAKERRPEALAAMVRMDLELGPDEVGVLGLVQALAASAESDDVALGVARAKARAPLIGRLRAKAREDRRHRAHGLLGQELLAHDLPEPRDRLLLGLGKRGRVDPVDAIPSDVHSAEA